MNGKHIYGFTEQQNQIFVLDHHTPDDVARAMIKNGKQKQPFYTFTMDETFQRIQHFKDMMPRVKIFYAVKANDTDMMLRLAVALGVGFDCASPGEIHKVRTLNVDPKSIIYAMACKTVEEMEYARKVGVRHTVFDASYELKKLKQYWPDARLLLRIRVDGKAKVNLGLKFGCDFETEAFDLLDEAANLGLRVVGVAFHVGSICYSAESYALGLQKARALFDHEERAGRHMNIVDIGGGFLGDRTDTIDEASYVINDTLDELFPDPSVQIIAEPGRYLCDSGFKMYCSVIGVKRAILENLPVNMIYINNGIHGTLRYDENWHKFTKFQRTSEIEPVMDGDTILWGPTCDSLDRVRKDYPNKLPACTSYDWLVIENHGAYTFTFATRFSSIPLPKIRTVVSKNLWNYIKKSTVFAPSDFALNPDISTPLPSTLPLVQPTDEIYGHSEIPTLKV